MLKKQKNRIPTVEEIRHLARESVLKETSPNPNPLAITYQEQGVSLPVSASPSHVALHNPYQQWPSNHVEGVLDVDHKTLPPMPAGGQAYPHAQNIEAHYVQQHARQSQQQQQYTTVNVNPYDNNYYSPFPINPGHQQHSVEEEKAAIELGWYVTIGLLLATCASLLVVGVVSTKHSSDIQPPNVASQPNLQKKIVSLAPKDSAAVEKLLPTLKLHDQVGPYEVSSPYGKRIDPITGEKSDHNGTDVAADSGVYYHVPGSPGTFADVGCRTPEQTNGGGFVADIFSKDPKYETLLRIQILHLQEGSCIAGKHVKAGSIVGRVGSTGRSTGPHAHVSVLVLKTRMVMGNNGIRYPKGLPSYIAPSGTIVYEVFGVKPPGGTNASKQS